MKALFSAVRATADWACVALSAIHQRGASLTDEPVTPAAYRTSAWSWSCAWGVLFLRRRSVAASVSSPPCLAEYQCASHVKQLFHLWPGGIVLLWFPDDNGACVVVGVLFVADLIPASSLLSLWVSIWVVLWLRPVQWIFVIESRWKRLGLTIMLHREVRRFPRQAKLEQKAHFGHKKNSFSNFSLWTLLNLSMVLKQPG